MSTVPFQACPDNPSYFSEKCKSCSFACLHKNDDDAEEVAARGTLSIPGVAAVAVGAAASVAGYPELSAGLTVAGAAAIVIRIFRK